VLEVNPAVFARYQRALAADLHGTVWEAGCSSWYKNASGRVTNNWPRRVLRYRERTRQPAAADFLLGQPETLG
jgi:hypothetical protein